jgi:hypothetical protein
MANSKTFSQFHPKPEDLESKFKRKLEAFSNFAVQFGLKIEPFSDITWPKFRSLSGPLQQQAFESFVAYSDLCVAAAESGVAINDDRSLAWWAVQKFGLRPCSDFFDKLTGDDVLELYDCNLVQLYRNWAFFQISSYSMGDLFVFPWPHLYKRDEAVMENLLFYAKAVLSGEHRSTIECVSPRHIVVESLSAEQNVLDMMVKYASPLFDSGGNIAAFFVISSVRKVGNRATDSDSVLHPDSSASHLRALI